jgi:hypothetical protein
MSKYLTEYRHHAGMDCLDEACEGCKKKRPHRESLLGKGPVREATESEREIAQTIIKQIVGKGFGFVNLEDYLMRSTGKMYQWSKPNLHKVEGGKVTVMVRFKGRGRKPGVFGLDLAYNEGRDLYDVTATFQSEPGSEVVKYEMDDIYFDQLSDPTTMFGGLLQQIQKKSPA